MSNLDTECPICYELYSNNVIKFIIEPCNHVCCKKCVDLLRICFYCRGTIRNSSNREIIEREVEEELPEREIAERFTNAFSRRRNLSLELTYFLINYCNCNLVDIENNRSINYAIQKIFEYVRLNNYLHWNDGRYIIVTPELRNLLIRDEQDIDYREIDENGNTNDYLSFHRVQLLLYKRGHF